MEQLQTRSVSPDDRLMAAIRIIVRQELATVLTSGEPKDRLLTVAEVATFLRLAVPTIYGLVISATRFPTSKRPSASTFPSAS
jgi:predicted DNA-binding transcriptional regulator AlpA